MDSRNISRLQEEQQRAIEETDAEIKQFEKFKSDYLALQKRLKTLPDKLTHDVMVPFGKLAFMPGQIVHTNEVLVLLGDNWFAERSAKQAGEIAGRRIKELEKRIQDLNDQKGLLEPRLGITSQLKAQADGTGDYKEIVEEYDEEAERLWDEKHKENMRRYHNQLREERTSAKPGGKRDNIVENNTDKLKSDEEIWSRLDALEKQEDERDELNRCFGSNASEDDDVSDDDDDDDGIQEAEDTALRDQRTSSSCDKRVSWVDEKNADGSCEEEDEDDGGDEEDDEDSDHQGVSTTTKAVTTTIRFSHSTAPPIQSLSSSRGASTNITSPADIYKLFCPTSILKKVKGESSAVPDDSGDHVMTRSTYDETCASIKEGANRTEAISLSRDKAFSGVVRENPTAKDSAPPPSGVTPATQQPEQPKRLSRFKAQRVGHKTT